MNANETVAAAGAISVLARRLGEPVAPMPIQSAIGWGMVLTLMALYAREKVAEVSMHVPSHESLVDDASDFLGFDREPFRSPFR